MREKWTVAVLPGGRPLRLRNTKSSLARNYFELLKCPRNRVVTGPRIYFLRTVSAENFVISRRTVFSSESS
jgi:hypothetical protein